MNRIIEVLPDKSSLIERAHALILDRIQSALKSQSRFTIALAGGSTPKPLYQALAQESLPWSKIHIFWGDERYVPASDPDSNQRMAREAWLDKIDIPQANIHAMNINTGDPHQDAKQHQIELQQFFQTSGGEFPTFDLILLGMGDDGHTASLFPHTEALKVTDEWVTVGEKNDQPRITFTLPVINQARCVLFLVAGENKRPALKEVFAQQGDAQHYPSRSIQPKGELLWLLDQSAGAPIKD